MSDTDTLGRSQCCNWCGAQALGMPSLPAQAWTNLQYPVPNVLFCPAHRYKLSASNMVSIGPLT